MSTLVTCLISPLGCRPMVICQLCTLNGRRPIFCCDPSRCPHYDLAWSTRSIIMRIPRRSRIHPAVAFNARLMLSARSWLLTNSAVWHRWQWLRKSVYVLIFECEAGVGKIVLEKVVMVGLDLPPQKPSRQITPSLYTPRSSSVQNPFIVQHGREPWSFAHVPWV